MAIREPALTLGIEEEYLLVRPRDGSRGGEPPDELFAALHERTAGRAFPEFLRAQVEVATPVCRDIGDARRELGGLRRAVIDTRHGDIELELFGDDAIQTVTSIALAKSGFYKNLSTHRVVPNFVVQGGDPRGDGNGDAGYTVPAEVSRHRYDTGYLGIADGGKDTVSCQWFITLSPQPHMDGRYTILGRVTKGMDAAWKLDQGDSFNVKIPE